MRQVLLVFLIFIVKFAPLRAQDSTAVEVPVSEFPTQLNKTRLITTLSLQAGFLTAGMSYLQFIWYKDVPRVPFEVYKDGKGYLQIDKCGHAYGAYLESTISYYSLRYSGVSKKKALMIGGPMGLLLQAPIEVWDGMYEGWGFSWGDMLANTAGASFFTLQELLFDKQLMKYKFSYAHTEYARKANGYLGATDLGRVFQDYNGHSYWLSIPLNLSQSDTRIPKWLNIAVGYSANGMYGEFENITRFRGVSIPPTERYRQYLLSLDVDWTRIKTKSKVLKVLFKGMTVVKLPFPALEYNSLGHIKGYWLYW